MKSVIIIAIAFVLLIPSSVFAQSGNTDSSRNENLDFNPALVVGIVSVSVAVIIVIFTVYYERQNLQFNVLLRFNQLLSNTENRAARKYVYNRWEDEFLKNNDGLFKDLQFIQNAEIIATTFDEVGVFIYKKINLKTKEKPFRFRGFINKDFFFSVYSGAVVNSWNTLEEFITRERTERETKYYMRYFEKLYDDAIEFREKNGLGKTKFQKLNEELKKNH